MTKTILSLSLILLGSTYTFGKTPYSYPNFKLELGLSIIDHLYTLTVPFKYSDYTPSDGICGEVHLVYNFKKGQAFSTGINYYEHLSAFSYPIPSEDTSTQEEQKHDNYSTNIIAFLFSYTVDKRLNRKILSFLEGGLSLNIPTHNYKEISENHIYDNTTQSSITWYKPDGIPMTAFIKLGLKIPNLKDNYFKISVVANFPANSFTLVEYKYGEAHSNYPNQGAVSSAFGYYGLSLNYAFTLTNLGKSLQKFSDDANDFFEK